VDNPQPSHSQHLKTLHLKLYFMCTWLASSVIEAMHTLIAG